MNKFEFFTISLIAFHIVQWDIVIEAIECLAEVECEFHPSIWLRIAWFLGSPFIPNGQVKKISSQWGH